MEPEHWHVTACTPKDISFFAAVWAMVCVLAEFSTCPHFSAEKTSPCDIILISEVKDNQAVAWGVVN